MTANEHMDSINGAPGHWELQLRESEAARVRLAAENARLVAELPTRAVDDWLMQLCHSHGITTVRWNDGTIGIEGPDKWVAVIQDLRAGMAALGQRQPLPKLLAPRRPGYQRGANAKRNRAQ